MAVSRLPLMLSLLLIAISAQAHASSNRLAALGGEPHLLLDTDNVHIYPATAAEFPHLGVELFQDWGGIVYPLNAQHVLGLFFNRPTPQLARFNRYLEGTDDPILAGLDVQPWVDILYGLRLRPNAHLGLAGSFNFDTLSQLGGEASAHSLDLRLGLRLGSTRVLDTVFGLTRQRFETIPEPAEEPTRRQNDGMGYRLGLRTRWPLDPSLLLLSSVDFEQESYALSPAQRDFRSLHLTAGINAHPAEGVLVLAGFIFDYQHTRLRLSGMPDQKDEVWLLPGTLVAGEVQVGSMLFRLGMQHENRLESRERISAGRLVPERASQSVLNTELGLGLEFGTLQIDGIFERDFFRDGPHLLGGSRHGGGIFSQISLTYGFSR